MAPAPLQVLSQRSALDPDHPPVGKTLLRSDVPQGLTLAGLRQDRILNEAVETADPLRLMRLFGIKEATAMHYFTVAHPERMAGLPRWPARRSVGGGGGRGSGSGGIADAHAQVLDVVEGLVEEFGDVVVVEGVDDRAPLTFACDQSEVAQQAELVGAGGCFHADGFREVTDRARAFLEPGQDV